MKLLIRSTKKISGNARLAKTSQKPGGESQDDRLKRAMSVMTSIAYQDEPGEGFNLFVVPREHFGLVENFANTLGCQIEIAPTNKPKWPRGTPLVAKTFDNSSVDSNIIIRVKKIGE